MHRNLAFAGLAALLGQQAGAFTVDTTYGPVSTTDVALNGVTAFRSIPFAAPPVGNNRFRAPQPPQPWTETLDVSSYAPGCPQLKIDGDLFIGSEDCLKLAVYVPPACHPSNTTAALCPVMYWIFGGGWVIGDGTEFGWYDGVNLAGNNGVVVVTVNYRVGPFGFMALHSLQAEDPDASTGNAGLLDQRFGMQWVRDNIKFFGGDPSKVTIFGESAGAFSVGFHLASENSKGLFRGAIIESGTLDSPQFFTPVAQNIAFNQLYSTAVGCNGTITNGGLDDSLTLTCLRSKSTQEIMKSIADWLNPNWPFTGEALAAGHPLAAFASADGSSTFDFGSYFSTAFKGAGVTQLPALAPIMPWAAAIDGSRAGLVDTPLNCILKGSFNRASVVIGTNRNEGSIFIPAFPLVVQGTHFPPTDADLPMMIEHALDMYPANLVANLTETVMNNYPPYPLDDNWARGSDILTHMFFSCATRRAARALSSGPNAVPVWLYQFSYKLTFLAGLENTLLGDYHTSELDFVWGNQWPPLLHTFMPSDWNLSTTIQNFWTNFARSGNPNSGTKVNPVYWPPYSRADDMNIQLDVPLQQNQHLLSALCDLWDGVTATLEKSVETLSHAERASLAVQAAKVRFYKGRRQAAAHAS